LTVAAPVPAATAVTPVGEPGTARASALVDGTDVVFPAALKAVTVKVYVLPRVRPERVAVVAVDAY
jgi:hypothetical protein